jgi:hypothetical protein
VASFDVDDNTMFFQSSGTTSENRSKHFINSIEFYRESFIKSFEHHYGKLEEYCFLFLLPGYYENEHSSLIYMCNEFLKISVHPLNGFYLDNSNALKAAISKLNESCAKTILLGVSYALIDLAETGTKLEPNIKVIETGGMKGTRKEMVKSELHDFLKSKMGISSIGGEYGMTELFSQAYSNGDGIYSCPPWMKVQIVDINDPFSYVSPNKTGGVNVIDLANYYTCSFIATQDLGRAFEDGSFSLQGRFDNSDLRGCNLLLS